MDVRRQLGIILVLCSALGVFLIARGQRHTSTLLDGSTATPVASPVTPAPAPQPVQRTATATVTVRPYPSATVFALELQGPDGAALVPTEALAAEPTFTVLDAAGNAVYEGKFTFG